jgi:hypothetical protein
MEYCPKPELLPHSGCNSGRARVLARPEQVCFVDLPKRSIWSASGSASDREDAIPPRGENEAPCEGRPFFDPHLGLKPQAQSYSPFGTKSSLKP